MDKNKIFPPHLDDLLRRQIAVRYIQHEWRKLFPQLRDGDVWRSIDRQIAEWPEMLSMRNFWNAVHGITTGFRLVSIVPWLTSLNVKWEEKDVPLDQIYFRGKFGPIASLEVEEPESAAAVKAAIFLSENAELLKTTRQFFEFHKDDTAPRDDDPIFAVKKDGRLRVIDGNGRTLKAIAEGKDFINAAIGEPISEPIFYEHWVSTSLLVDLVFWNKHYSRAGRDTTETTANMIAELIQDSSAGRIEFTERAVHHDDEIHMRLFSAVRRVLEARGINLEIPSK
ncbi:MAG: hypothetical protein HZA25_02295 [Candidatus Niyogibacteria bacterium]|nr:hypothetical protein [Candidatus Niyogibacteria bacterium]